MVEAQRPSEGSVGEWHSGRVEWRPPEPLLGPDPVTAALGSQCVTPVISVLLLVGGPGEGPGGLCTLIQNGKRSCWEGWPRGLGTGPGSPPSTVDPAPRQQGQLGGSAGVGSCPGPQSAQKSGLRRARPAAGEWPTQEAASDLQGSQVSPALWLPGASSGDVQARCLQVRMWSLSPAG